MGFFDRLTKKILRHPPEEALNMNRNQPCWCGSGKKYKKCHYDSDRKHFMGRGSACRPSS
jgi:hypothetical protein